MPTIWDIEIDGSGKQDLRRTVAIIASSMLTVRERNYLAIVGTRAAARIVRNEARRLAPTRTGQLRSAIRIEDRPSRAPGGFGQVAFGRAVVTVNEKRAPYWPFVEYGHRVVRNKKVFGRVRAYPFLRPALSKTRDRQFRAASRAMTREFLRIKGSQATKRLLISGPKQTQQAALPAPAPVLLLPPPRY